MYKKIEFLNKHNYSNEIIELKKILSDFPDKKINMGYGSNYKSYLISYLRPVLTFDRNNFVLDVDTWSPINTQNTCYSSEIIPASLVLPHVGRFDDIWGNYLLRKVIDVMGHYTSYGKPIVIQERNEHDLWKDLEQELNGYKFGKYFIDRINEIYSTLTQDSLSTIYRGHYYGENSYSLKVSEVIDTIVIAKLTELYNPWVKIKVGDLIQLQ